MEEIKEVKDGSLSNESPLNTACRINDNIWISGHVPAFNQKFLKKFNITRIIRMFKHDLDGDKYDYPGIDYLIIPADDVPDYRIDQHFDETIKFIAEGIKKNQQVLIHCYAGISRSSTIVLMYLMCCGFDLPAAYKYLHYHRECINPNAGFVNQLIMWGYGGHGKKYCQNMLKKYDDVAARTKLKLPKIAN